MFFKAALQIVDSMGQIGIRRVGTHDPDGLDGPQPQPSGKGVWGVACFFYNRKDFFPGSLTDFSASVKDPGNGSNGHAGLPGMS